MERNIQKYEILQAAVDRGNITKAAQDLAFSQSSASKMIADLESEWNLKVLDRSKSGVCLTEDGKILMPYVRRLLDACEQLDGKVKEIGGLACGKIRIGVFYSVAEHWLPRIIAAFQKDYPAIRYELLTGDYDEIESWLEEGRVDCGFLRLPTQKAFDTAEIRRDEYRVILPQKHELCAKKSIDPQDLDGQPFLLLEHGGRTEVTEFLEHYHLKPDIRFTTWDDYSIMAMVEMGQGIALLPDLILQRNPYDIVVRPLSVECGRQIGVAVKNRDNLSSAMKKFLSYIRID